MHDNNRTTMIQPRSSYIVSISKMRRIRFRIVDIVNIEMLYIHCLRGWIRRRIAPGKRLDWHTNWKHDVNGHTSFLYVLKTYSNKPKVSNGNKLIRAQKIVCRYPQLLNRTPWSPSSVWKNTLFFGTFQTRKVAWLPRWMLAVSVSFVLKLS